MAFSLNKLLFGTSGAGPSVNLFNQLSLQQQQMLNQALGLAQVGYGQIAGGFAGARSAAKQAKGEAKADVRSAATQTGAAVTNSAVSRGTSGVSTSEAALRGVGSDLARHLAWIDTRAGDVLGDIDIQEAMAKMQGLNLQGNLFTQFGAQNADLARSLFPVVGQGSPGILGPVLGAAGMAGGFGKLFSDPRLKKNVEFECMIHGPTIGRVPVYSFEYKDPNLPGRFLGVMSSDVRRIPGVVSKNKDGYESVDYLLLHDLTGFSFKRLEEAHA